MKEKIKIIKDFAKKMGYKTREYNYSWNSRKCHSIELLGTSDSEGNPFEWAWYLDTEEEIED